MIKAIIFDDGGVFVIGTSETFFEKASKIFGINIKKKDVNEEWDYLVKGKINIREFIRKIFKVNLSNGKLEKAVKIWVNNWKLDSKMVLFAKKLKSKYTLALLSDSEYESAKRGEEDQHFSLFDYKFLSFELSFKKPEREFYEHALKIINVKPEECAFIDDKLENVEAAQKLGIHGIVFKNLEQLKKELKKLGVVVQ